MIGPAAWRRQRGAALLLALLTVALITTLAVSAFWQQWRNTAVERAERERSQALWLLNGALDWARIILREAARGSTVDDLAEPWAVPLQETRLSSFLNAGDEGAMANAFLSGQITDEQGKVNLRNLIDTSGPTPKLSSLDAAAAARLFSALGLPEQELTLLETQLLNAYGGTGGNTDAQPLQPQRLAQLVWLGVSSDTLQALAPYATWLPEPTPLNLNTASASALYATLGNLDMAQAQSLITRRNSSHFNNINEVGSLFPAMANQLSSARESVNSRYFLVQGQLRLNDTVAQQRSLVVRNGTLVTVVWTEHHGLSQPAPQPLQ